VEFFASDPSSRLKTGELSTSENSILQFDVDEEQTRAKKIHV
jgi:hypothetical protein